MPDIDLEIQRQLASLSERIAVLEAHRLATEEKIRGMDERTKEILAALGTTNKNIAAISTEISAWKGKFGGVLFAVGCVWAFITGFPAAFVNWVKTFGGLK